MRTVIQKDFKYGIIDTIEAHSIPRGAASKSKNWLTLNGKLELIRGRYRLGSEITGNGSISGLGVGRKPDGTELLVRTRGRRVEYYSASAGWIEVGTNILPAAANNEDISFAAYNSLSGYQLWLSSPNSGLYKMMVGSPASMEDNFGANNFRGYIKIKQNRMWLWNRGSTSSAATNDRLGLYLSYLDRDEVSDYTSVSAEAFGTGNGSTRQFSATLAAVTGVRTCFAVSVTDGTETFFDNRDGSLTGNQGGTGVVNYTTGVVSVTFATAPTNLQAITASYYWEDSTSSGVADFTHSTPRTAGQGAAFRQDDGGGVLQNVFTISNIEYCMHELKTWAVNVTNTDTSATNLPFRERIGIPNWRAAVDTGEGIYFIDDTDQNDPTFKLLTYNPLGSGDIVPVIISKPVSISKKPEGLNLNDFRFNRAWVLEWGNYIVFGCRHKDSTQNNRIFLYNRITKVLDVIEEWANCAVIYGGDLIIGDSLSDNVYILFTGTDQDGGAIANSWEGNLDDLDVERLKKFKKLVIQGEIGSNQIIDVSLSYDRGTFTSIGTIRGDGSYVDKSQAVNVGSLTMGRGEVGGGSGGITAYNYIREFNVWSSEFKEVKIRFRADAIGYASVSSYEFRDVRIKGLKSVSRYRV